LFQKYSRFEHIAFYGCPVVDQVSFLKQLATDFNRYPANSLALDFMPIQRASLIPIINISSLAVLSLRGCQCITPYDFLTHGHRPFPPSLNSFFAALSTSNIRVLNLYGCHLGDDGASAFASMLYFNTSLLCISLGRNRIGDIGAKALASALSTYVLSPQEALIVDQLKKREFQQKISDEGGGLLKRKRGQKVARRSPVRRTHTVRGKIEEKVLNFDPAAPVSTVVLNKWKSYVKLENGMCGLTGNSTVTSLVLDENVIGERGVEALKEMLGVNKNVIHFSIAHNPDIPLDVSEALSRRPEIS
jgi:hypothetical protein